MRLPIDGIGMPSEPGLRFASTRTRNPNGAVRHRHNGVDLFALAGTPVRAIADGIVVKVVREPGRKPPRPRFDPQNPPRDHGGYGVVVDVRHSDGRWSRYSHMQRDSVPAELRPGVRVLEGHQLGAVGTTRFTWQWVGAAAGDWRYVEGFVRSNAHLHFEVIALYPPPREGGRVDPEAHFRDAGVPFVSRRKAAQITEAKRANQPTTPEGT